MSTVLGVGFNVTAAEVIAQVLDPDRWRFLDFEGVIGRYSLECRRLVT
jgi:hypothetical protein